MSAVLDWNLLHAHFAKRLQERLAGFDATLHALTLEPNDATRAALERQFHSLAGIGGTYGYPKITDLAREGELLCSRGGTTAELRTIVEAIREI